MNRRNVLGNKIEASKSCWIVIMGIAITALQCLVNYHVGADWLRVLIFVLFMTAGSLAVHFITGELGELFTLLLIPVTFFGVLGIMLPFLSGAILPAARTVFLISVTAWVVPVVYAVIFAWSEGFSVMEEFAALYLKANVVFYVVYFGVVIYRLASAQIAAEDIRPVQMIPFATFAAYFDGLVKGTVSGAQMLDFLTGRVAFFIPYGFFIAMVARRLHGAIRILLLIVLPALLEVFQLVFSKGSFDVDDIIFSFLGGLVGMIVFYIFNTLFQNITNRNFDGSEVNRDYYGRKI